MPLALSDFDYPLDSGLIAQTPAEPRDASRLMAMDRRSGSLSHHTFRDLPGLLRPGDLLVMNDTRVVPARFFCRRGTGGRIDGLFLLACSEGLWEVLLRGAGRCKIGERLKLLRSEGVTFSLRQPLGEGKWAVEVQPPHVPADLLGRAGQVPLPPYIHRSPGGEEAGDRLEQDRLRYQTIYAVRDGAVAAPTAGLHFTEEVLAALAGRGIQRTCVTLHVGLGTFAPVKTEDLSAHRMHREWYDLPAAAAAALNAARADGRRVVAIGTTSIRVLETAIGADGRFAPTSGWTGLFLYPPTEFRAVEALITNFHLPRSTLLMLVAAFCQPGGIGGVEMIRRAYAEAAALRYRFYSYGDAMLIV